MSTGSIVLAKRKNNEELSSHTDESARDINEDFSVEIHKISLSITGVRPLKKRLLVLDLNGLLTDVVSPPPKDRKADITIARRARKNCVVL